jgi:hypothetical protein
MPWSLRFLCYLLFKVQKLGAFGISRQTEGLPVPNFHKSYCAVCSSAPLSFIEAPSVWLANSLLLPGG